MVLHPQASDPGAPYCAPSDSHPRKPRLALPAGSCDCHAHVFGPATAYPYSPARIYTPPDALPADYVRMLRTVGVERAVLIQPSVYGADNAAMLAAMADFPLPCRGVAVVDGTVSDAEIARLHKAGIRGIRFNVVDVKEPTGTMPLAAIEALALRVKPLGWHVEFLAHVDDHPDLDRMFGDFPVPIAFGHMGYMRPPLTLDNPGFAALLRLLRGGRCWVKFAGPSRISAGEMPHADVQPVARALVEAAPMRMIWGSDWPHVIIPKAMPNDGDLVDLLADWIPDPARRRQVLVDNPTALYGFPV